MSFADWFYKQTHTITHGTGLTDYQVKFTVYKTSGTSSGSSIYCNTHCNDDFSDIRFSVDNVTALPYWIESYTSGVSAKIWVKLPTIDTTTVSIFYGNAAATSESNGDNTFVFFDDFEGVTLDVAKWNPTLVPHNSGTGTVAVSGGAITITQTAGVSKGIGLSSLNALADNTNTIRVKVNSRSTGSSSTAQVRISVTSPTTPDPGSFGIYINCAESRHYLHNYQGVGEPYITETFVTSTPVIYDFQNNVTNPKFYKNDVLGCTGTGNPTDPLGNYIRIWCYSTTTATVIDWIVARKYAATEPTQGSWGGEMYVGGTGVFISANPSSGTLPLSTSISISISEPITDFELLYGDGESYNVPDRTYNVFLTSLYSDGAAYTGYTYRNVISSANILESANTIRIKLTRSSGGTLILTHVAIVERDGSTANGTTIPTEITFNNGTSGVTVTSASDVYSDWISYTIDPTKDYLFIVDRSVTSTGICKVYAGSSYYKISATSWDTQSLSEPFNTASFGNPLFAIEAYENIITLSDSFSITHTYDTFGTYQIYTSGYIGTTLYEDYETVIISNNSLTAAFVYPPYQGTTIYNNPTTSAYTNSGAKTFRSLIPAASITSNAEFIRIKLKASAAFVYSNISIVERSGTSYNGTTTPTLLTVNGNYSGTISSNASILTDPIKYHIDETKDYLFIIDFPAGSYPATYAATWPGASAWGSSQSAASQTFTQSGTNEHTCVISHVEIVSHDDSSTLYIEHLQFSDASTGSPNEWFWDFGDGSTSQLQNPTHSYQAPGTYTVTLYASNQEFNGYTTTSITVANPTPVVDYDYTTLATTEVMFTPIITTNIPLQEHIISYYWDFGDEAYSSLRSPIHVYAATGTYTISLTVTNNYGITATHSQDITFITPYNVKFSPCYEIGGIGHIVYFHDLTVPQTGILTRSWSFGDDGTSTDQNPTHTYTTAGIYSPSLTVTYASGSSSLTKINTIMINQRTKLLVDNLALNEALNKFNIMVFIESLLYGDTCVRALLFTERVAFTNDDLPEYGLTEFGHSFKGTLTGYGESIYGMITGFGRKIIVKTPLINLDCFKTLTFMKFKERIAFKQTFEKNKL